jgi:general secretion pathway protein A
MYADFFGLKQSPFSIAPDPRYLFMSERHREALAHLLYGVQGGGGFVLLTGEIGTGKTTICRCFLEQTPENCRVAYIFNPKLTVVELLRTVCDEFGVQVSHQGPGEVTAKDHIDPLNAFLLASHAAGQNTVLIIDEAQNLSADVLEQLRLLTNLETNTRKLLQIILIGQPELRRLLARPELEQLAQRVIARFHLDALDEAETRQYIQHRMDVAGLHGPLPFTRDALRRIHSLTAGVPRRINLLCDRALLGAYASGQHRVERAVVDKAATEVFDTLKRSAPTRSRRPLASLTLVATGAVSGALLVFAAMQVDKNPVKLATEAGAPPSAAAPPQPAMADPAPTDETTAPATVRDVEPPPLVEVPAFSDLLRSETLAWHALGRTWNQSIEQGEPCATALQHGLQCYRTGRMTLHGLRQLGRPGLLTLHLPGQPPAWALLVAMGMDSAVLQAGERRWQLPLTGLADIWRGDYATLWRLPPGQSTRLVDGRQGLAAEWLNTQLGTLQRDGKLVPSAATLDARVQTFQRAHGIDANGLAGPVTFMQVNRARGVDEPRLQPL